jgi:hypothetical protein
LGLQSTGCDYRLAFGRVFQEQSRFAGQFTLAGMPYWR